METEALRCLQRPYLSGRKNKDVIYETQQIVCGASLDFARNAHPLERERIKAAENCKIQLSECSEHQEIMNALFQLVQGMFTQIN